jgi:excisionase family DNA binding protein
MNKGSQAEFGNYAFASAITGIKVNTLYALVNRKRIPHIKINRRFIQFKKTDLLEWLEEHKVPTKKHR